VSDRAKRCCASHTLVFFHCNTTAIFQELVACDMLSLQKRVVAMLCTRCDPPTTQQCIPGHRLPDRPLSFLDSWKAHVFRLRETAHRFDCDIDRYRQTSFSLPTVCYYSLEPISSSRGDLRVFGMNLTKLQDVQNASRRICTA
jgi:hypothetical protein